LPSLFVKNIQKTLQVPVYTVGIRAPGVLYIIDLEAQNFFSLFLKSSQHRQHQTTATNED